MGHYQSLRTVISKCQDELVIYGANNFSQFPTRDASISSKCDRALAAASNKDLVVLRGELDQDYHRWLRSYGLGSDYVVEYKKSHSDKTLSELIVENPEPIKKVCRQLGRRPVYVPWFSAGMEATVATALGAELFGAEESDTLKYNDKAAFKALCQQLGVAVVDGAAFEMQPANSDNYLQMVSVVEGYLSTYDTVIIRGTLGESGMSLFKTQGDDLAQLYQTIAASGEKVVLIEPFLNVLSSPSDHWAIGRDGGKSHIAIFEQLCEDGMVHVGNLKGRKPAPQIYNAITQASKTIVTAMAKAGYKGLIGIDYIVTDEGIFPVENNARFNGSSYVELAVNRIEELLGLIPYWKFLKIKTSPCTFLELTQRISSVIYDGIRVNSVFPLNSEDLSRTGSFGVVLLAEDLDHIYELETSLKTLGVSRD